ncbi:hypothetical protein Xen7305DRAFT_00045630 [Xenococcus sp. PCC 7305]|uniref:hypothetical protein n=1 Tax=Xenococcus sp. PCC 7305 TaxID=102125 RepID=UPI0002AC116C|nr:hypothetical protein [Xenococcus sp. PCC 7305]ELS04827.1 hypothetical protein Xen7305DRAFT_00045630 [Xenococcus sp. PCC 7305]
MSPGNPTKLAWVLVESFTWQDESFYTAWEVFDEKETCFQKYPGDWREVTDHIFITEHLPGFDGHPNQQTIALHQVSFTQKSDVKT